LTDPPELGTAYGADVAVAAWSDDNGVTDCVAADNVDGMVPATMPRLYKPRVGENGKPYRNEHRSSLQMNVERIGKK
jgi:hypothetical protein